jgi:hypothetical protein
MNPKGCAANLIQAVKDLSVEWQETKASWRDLKSQEFERNYLEEIPDHAARATAIMGEIEILLRKVRSDCE